MTQRSFSPVVHEVIEDFLPICHNLAEAQGGPEPHRFAIAVGGSLGKGTWDTRSDIDFRLYTDFELPWGEKAPGLWVDYFAAIERWKEKGIFVDGVWCRTVHEIDSQLDRWIKGKGQPLPLLWTIWGYHVLPDMYHQHIIEDPFGIIAGWKERLRVYPPSLKQAILEQYVPSLKYWRSDYHFANKVTRADYVFTAGMTSKLVHEIMQILFSLNETYYVGDGSNMNFARKFAILPANFEERVCRILYPGGPDSVNQQYDDLAKLIDEVIALSGAQ